MPDKAPVNPEDVEVKLKPFLGVQPATYLPVLYGFLLLVILFLLLFLPGIVRPGTVFTVVSTPPNAAVSVDGVIRGASGRDVFVPAAALGLVPSSAARGHAVAARKPPTSAPHSCTCARLA